MKQDLIDRIRNVFDWASVIRTHRFMNHFYKIMGPAQQKGLSLASDMVDQGIRAFLNETELQFDSFAVKRGASLLDLTGLLKDSKTSNEAYEDSYEPDAKTHYFMDRVIENAPNSELLEHTVAEEHEVELDTITREFSEEFAEQLDPRAYDSMHHNISDFFRHGSSVLNRPLDRTIRLLHNVLSFIDRSTEQFFGSVDKFMGKIMTLVMKLLDIPIYIPFLSHYWKDVIAPGFGHISILHLYTLVGSCQATWMYKLYRHGREPFNDRDIEVLESVSNPQLILYTWKSDPLTASNDADVAHKRMAIFDWIPRMCAATFVTLTKSIQIVIPNKFEMTHKVVKFTRYVSTYLINAWFFPVKQVCL